MEGTGDRAPGQGRMPRLTEAARVHYLESVQAAAEQSARLLQRLETTNDWKVSGRAKWRYLRAHPKQAAIAGFRDGAHAIGRGLEVGLRALGGTALFPFIVGETALADVRYGIRQKITERKVYSGRSLVRLMRETMVRSLSSDDPIPFSAPDAVKRDVKKIDDLQRAREQMGPMRKAFRAVMGMPQLEAQPADQVPAPGPGPAQT